MMMRELLRRVERLGSSAEASAEERELKELQARLKHASDAYDEESAKHRYDRWTNPKVQPPSFAVVVSHYERDPVAAKAEYVPLLKQVLAHENEAAANELKRRELKAEVNQLETQITEHEMRAAQNARKKEMATFKKKYSGLTLDELKATSLQVYDAFIYAKTSVDYKFGFRERDPDRAIELDKELDALAELLLEKHQIKTTYKERQIQFNAAVTPTSNNVT